MFGIAAIFDYFGLYLATDFDCTPVETIAALLLQSLQRIPDVAESRSLHLIPLFLNFMGYDDSGVVRYLYKIIDFCTYRLKLRNLIIDAFAET
jgi:CBS domain containing-hemolysin-like protein